MNLARSFASGLALLCLHCAAPSSPPTPDDPGPAKTASTPAPSAALPESDPVDMLGGLGTWEGTGTVHAVSGESLGAFRVSIHRTAAGAHRARTEGKVTLANGHVITFWQDLEDHEPRGFSIVSSNGNGGGRCFANGMCQTYEEREGHAFATTLTKDTSGRIRLLTTELEAGKAVRFTEQTLLRN